MFCAAAAKTSDGFFVLIRAVSDETTFTRTGLRYGAKPLGGFAIPPDRFRFIAFRFRFSSIRFRFAGVKVDLEGQDPLGERFRESLAGSFFAQPSD